MARTDAIDAVVDCCAGADVLVVGASVVLVLVLELVLVSGGRVEKVVAVVTDAACDFTVPPPPSDEQATRVNPSASPALARPRGRLSMRITAFDCSRAAIVPHFFHLVDIAQVTGPSRRYLFCLWEALHRGGSP
jgi:hypothetical protein